MLVNKVARHLAWFAGGLLSLMVCTQQTHAVAVLTSIKPLALIAEELALESDSVEYLLPAGVSPHAFSLRVSQMRRLHEADLVLWVGPELETFMAKPLASRARAGVMEVSQLPGLHWPEDSGAVAAAQHDHTHDHEHDPHLWLNPENAQVIVRALTERLAQLNPDAALAYTERAERVIQHLAELDEEFRGQMQAIGERGFAVYHDGYRHWVEQYGLKQVDFVTVTPEQRPGARHLVELQERLRSQAHCLFIEPYSDVSEATRMAYKLGIEVAELDPLASAESLASYEQLLRHIANSLSACLLGQH